MTMPSRSRARRAARAERQRQGIAIDAATWAELNAAAGKVGLAAA